MGIPATNTNQAQMNVSPATALGMQDIYTISETKQLPLGTFVRLADGRGFVYGKAGATALAAGKLTQSAAPTQEDQAVTVTAAVGDMQLSVTTDSETTTLNQYAGGFVYVNDDTGESQMYTIRGNAAATTTGPVTLYLYEKVRTAITAGSGTVSIVKHPCDGLIVSPTTLTASVCGVPNVAVTAAYYAWFQVLGVCPVLTDGTIVVGEWVAPSNGTAGAVEALVAATTPDCAVGVVTQVCATTEYSLVNLCVPGF